LACQDCFSTPQELTGETSAGLKRNIQLLVSDTLPNRDLLVHINRLARNFYSPIGIKLANICVSLMRYANSKTLTKDLFDIAYLIENSWRAKNLTEYTYQTLINPESFDKITYSELCSFDDKYENQLKDKLKWLKYGDYLRTPYWKSIRVEMLRIYYHRCAHCPAETQLEVHHMSYRWVGEDHKHLDNLVVMCRLHHQRFHDIDNEIKNKKSK